MLWKTFGDHAVQHLGFAVAGVGDLTGDGIPDILVGQPFDGANSNGMARVLSGQDGSTVYSIYGAKVDGFLGIGIASLGDVDGDGTPDFAVGAPGVDGTFSNQGEMTVYSGATGTSLYTVSGTGTDGFGAPIAATGDLDGDGVCDFVVGAEAQYALVLSGADGATIWKLTDPKTPISFGTRVGGGGDIDGDGIPDIVVSDYYSSAGVKNGGAVWAFSGSTGAVLYEFDSTVKDANLGYSVTIPGDVNADGFADILIGAPFDSHIVTGGGSATVYSGKDGSVLLSYNATAGGPGLGIGWGVSGAGDTNNDGFADFLVGAGNFEAFLYSGRDGGLLYHFQDVSPGAAGFTSAMALVGDIDSDGRDDFVFTAPGEDHGSILGTGSVSAWRGHDFFVDTTPRIAYFNSTVTATIGQGISGNPYALFLLGMNGTPTFTLLGLGALDVTGRAILGYTIASPPGTNILELQAFTLDANNHLLASGVETFYTQ
jgi:hypothetical protein